MALRVLAAAPLVLYGKWESKHCHIPIWLAGSECWLQKHHYFLKTYKTWEGKLGSRAGQSCRNADFMKGEKNFVLEGRPLKGYDLERLKEF